MIDKDGNFKFTQRDADFEDAYLKAAIKRGLSLPWWKKPSLYAVSSFYKRIWKRIRIYLGFQKPDVF